MRCSSSIASIAPALVAAQAELKAIVKDAKNPHFKSKYASLDNIIEGVRPILAKHQLALIQGGLEGQDYGVETTIMHRSGEWISVSIIVPLTKNEPQVAGSATTYGRRYGASAILALVTDDDDDGERSRAPVEAKVEDDGYHMPFGKPPIKGQVIGTQSTETLEKALVWTRDPANRWRLEEYKNFIATAMTILNDRALDQTEEVAVGRMLKGVEREQADLPF